MARQLAQRRVFLLSPANAGGERAKTLLAEGAEFALAVRLRERRASLGEIYSFMSGLYFRGKVAYSQAFSVPPEGVPSSVVITPGAGLVPLETCISLDDLRAIARVSVDEDNAAFREPLKRDAQLLDQYAGADCLFVLLGSIATEKYVTPLLEVFGERLVFPSEFVGRGDMSRGGLMLRSARSGVELTYLPVRGAVRRGARPPRLARLPRRPEAVILTGLQGSGKTTYYEQHYRSTHVQISRDLQPSAQGELELYRKCLQDRQSCVVDDTNVTRAARAQFVAAAKAAGFRVIACYFDVPVRTAMGRNNHRQDKKPIPVPALLRLAKRLEPPTVAEGFDEVIVVR